MKITFIGAAHEVTGSCHLVEACGKHFLVDCGMEQGADIYENQDLPVAASDIDYVFVTHAHVDHSGLLPLMYVRGFRGDIFCTEATRKLCNIMLKDCAHIQEQETEWKNRKAARSGREFVEPMYTVEDAQKTMELFASCDYGQKIHVCDGIDIRFVDAGHLLGSSSIEVWLTENGEQRKIVFSGDLGNPGRPLIRDPEYIDDADYVLMESTYGDRYHEAPAEDFTRLLAETIEDTMRRGGNVVIPAFSVGRTQEMLYCIRHIKQEHLISAEYEHFDVYMDSPMAVEATTVFGESERDYYDEEALKIVRAGGNPIGFPELRIAVTADESKAINFDKKPKVIISASGMCEAGRIRHHLKHNLWRPECTVVFVGYQCGETLGRRLLDGVDRVKLFGEEVQVRAKIVNLPGVSGHGDRGQLSRWIGHFHPGVRRVFVVHGEDEVTSSTAEWVTAETGFEATAPYSGESWDLLENRLLEEGNKVRLKEKSVTGISGTQIAGSGKKSRTPSAAYERLVAAGQRLLTVIRHNEGGANKDLAKLADQITALCDKWDR